MPFTWKNSPQLPVPVPPVVIPTNAVSSEVDRVANTVNIGGTLSYNTAAEGFDVVYQVPSLNVVIMNITTGTVTTNAESNLSITSVQFVLSSIANAIANIPAPSGGGGGGLTQVARGLRMRTDPNQNSQNLLSKVVLIYADELVMSDGVVANSGWINLFADIDANGANGLSIGTKANSTWYEIHAIRKKANGTQGLIIHKADNYVMANDQYTPDVVSGVGEELKLSSVQNGADNDRLANPFISSANGKVTGCDVVIGRVGSPGGNYWFTIESSVSNNPSGTPLATSRVYPTYKVGENGFSGVSEQRIIFETPTSVVSGTKYWLVMRCDYPFPAAYNHFLYWYGEDDFGTNPTSIRRYNSGTGTWSSSWKTIDKYFRARMWIKATPYVTLASVLTGGYNQSCLLGYVFYNNTGAGNTGLSYFTQQNRTIWYGKNSKQELVDGSFIAGFSNPLSSTSGLVIQDLTRAVPPVSCLSTFSIEEIHSISTANVVFASLENLDANSSNRLVGATVVSVPLAGESEVVFQIEHSGVMELNTSSEKVLISKTEF